MRFQSNVFIGLFLLVGISSALSLPSRHTSAALRHPEGHDIQPSPIPPTLSSLSQIAPRSLFYPDWIRDHVNFGTVNAASVITVMFYGLFCKLLIQLFNTVIDHAINVWAKSPELNQVVVEAGATRFEFGCTMTPVPWEFVVEASTAKRDAIKRGFAPTFEQEWWFHRPDMKRVCYAGFRLVPDGKEPMKPEVSG